MATKTAQWDPPGPSKEALEYVEREIVDIKKRSTSLADKLGIDQKQAFWAFVTLYVNYYK